MSRGSRRARECVPGVDDLEGRHLLSLGFAGQFASLPEASSIPPAIAVSPSGDAGRFALLPGSSLPGLPGSPPDFPGGFASSSGAAPFPPAFSHPSAASGGNWPDGNAPGLALLGRNAGPNLGNAPWLSQDLPGTGAGLPGPNFPLNFDTAPAHAFLFDSSPPLAPDTQDPAPAAAFAAAAARTSMADAHATSATPTGEIAAGENLTPGPPGQGPPLLVVPIGGIPMAAPTALPVPSLGGRPTPPLATGADRTIPPVSTAARTLSPRPDGIDPAPAMPATASVATRVASVADLSAIAGQRPSPQRDAMRDTAVDRLMILGAAGLLDVAPPVDNDHETITAAFGRLLDHLEPDPADTEPVESPSDPLVLVAGVTILAVARRHSIRRSAQRSARRPRRVSRSTLWGLS